MQSFSTIYVTVSFAFHTFDTFKLTPSDVQAGDIFGGHVTISENTAIVGASDDDDHGDFSGSAYIFVWNGSTWTLQQKLTAEENPSQCSQH